MPISSRPQYLRFFGRGRISLRTPLPTLQRASCAPVFASKRQDLAAPLTVFLLLFCIQRTLPTPQAKDNKNRLHPQFYDFCAPCCHVAAASRAVGTACECPRAARTLPLRRQRLRARRVCRAAQAVRRLRRVAGAPGPDTWLEGHLVSRLKLLESAHCFTQSNKDSTAADALFPQLAVHLDAVGIDTPL